MSKDPAAERHPRTAAAKLALCVRRSFDRSWETGGAGRNRTDDILLAKQTLSQLSYGPMPFPEEWWARVDSNYRPHPYRTSRFAAGGVRAFIK